VPNNHFRRLAAKIKRNAAAYHFYCQTKSRVRAELPMSSSLVFVQQQERGIDGRHWLVDRGPFAIYKSNLLRILHKTMCHPGLFFIYFGRFIQLLKNVSWDRTTGRQSRKQKCWTRHILLGSSRNLSSKKARISKRNTSFKVLSWLNFHRILSLYVVSPNFSRNQEFLLNKFF